MSRISFSSVITVNQGYMHLCAVMLLYSIQSSIGNNNNNNNNLLFFVPRKVTVDKYIQRDKLTMKKMSTAT